MYFHNCKTLDQAKNLFRDLCKKLHPDTSGKDSQADFIRMYNEFKNFRPSENKKGDENFNADKFYNLVKKFEHLENIKVSFVGSFVWLEDMVKGATYNQKEEIKKISLDGYNVARFARKKIAWYFSPLDYKQRSKSGKSLDQIKNTYGCNSFNMLGSKKLTA